MSKAADLSWLLDPKSDIMLFGEGWREKCEQLIALPRWSIKPSDMVKEFLLGTRRVEDAKPNELVEIWKHVCVDIVAFVWLFGVYKDKMSRDWKRGDLKPGQLAILWRTCILWQKRLPIRIALLKYRRGGFSFITSAMIAWFVMCHENRGAMAIANDKGVSKQILVYIKNIYERLPADIKPARKAKSTTKLWLEETDDEKDKGNYGLNSGALVDTVGKDFVGTGEDVQFVQFSELGKIDKLCDPEEQYNSVTNTISEVPETAIVLESTAHGSDTFWHSIWSSAGEAARGGDFSDFCRIFVAWYTDPQNDLRCPPGVEWGTTRDDEYGDEAGYMAQFGLTESQMWWRRTFISKQKTKDEAYRLPLFRQEYPSTPEEAWLHATGLFLPALIVENVRDNYVLNAKPIFTGELEHRRDLGHPLALDKWTKPKRNGPLRIWRLPQAGSLYLAGADISSGQAVDASCVKFYEVDRKTQSLLVAAEVHGLYEPGEFAHCLWRLGLWYHSALLNWERTGPGMNIAYHLRRGPPNIDNVPYPTHRMFRRRRIAAAKMARESVFGTDTGGATKRPLMTIWAGLFASGRVQCLPEDVDEAGGVTLEGNKIETGGLDRVMAQVMACYALETLPYMAPEEVIEQKREPEHGSVDWADKMFDDHRERMRDRDEIDIFTG